MASWVQSLCPPSCQQSYLLLLMRRSETRKQPSRRFKLKSTRRYEHKMNAKNGGMRRSGETDETGAAGDRSPCDDFLEYCLRKSEEIRVRLDPEGVENRQATYKCKFCLKIFMKSTALGGHISKVHKEESRIFNDSELSKNKIEESFNSEYLPKEQKIPEDGVQGKTHRIAKRRRAWATKREVKQPASDGCKLQESSSQPVPCQQLS